MNFITNYLISRNSAKLNRLIEKGAKYPKLVKQSQKLDKYIMIAMKKINKL